MSVIIHDRVGIQGQRVLIDEDSVKDIPEELHADLSKIQELSAELNNSRLELGRLQQVVFHLINVCNTAERNLSKSKEHLIKSMGLDLGNWAVDFETKQVGRVLPPREETPRVV